MKTLASIAFALRYCNMTEEDDSQVPLPWDYQNIPKPVRVVSSLIPSRGKGTKAYTNTVEYFEDGSSFATSG